MQCQENVINLIVKLDWKGFKPGSVLCLTARHGHLSRVSVATDLQRLSSPLVRHGSCLEFPLGGIRALHQMGFAEPRFFQTVLVVSYTTVSTLPREAVYFLLHFPSASRLQNSRVTTLWFARRPAVSWHLALRCPDFPHQSCDQRDHAPFRGQSVTDMGRDFILGFGLRVMSYEL